MDFSIKFLNKTILFLHKIVNGRTPSYLREILNLGNCNLEEPPPNILNPARYNATNRYKSSLLPDSIKNWNAIISHFQLMPTLPKLKTHLHSLFRPVKKSVFSIHDPMGLRFIFQLRVGLSPLRKHKKNHKFLDTPTDHCLCETGSEDTRHFFSTVHYFLYTEHR